MANSFSDSDLRALEAGATQYLREQLGDRAPDYLRLEGHFSETPLEGEGRVWLFSFPLQVGAATAECGEQARKHYVAVGETTPNYFPAYDLGPNDAYSFHIGTRFMLTMEIQIVDSSHEPPGARNALQALLENYAQGAQVEEQELAALFRCEEAYFAVYRVRLNGAQYYCFGADCPSGFCAVAAHPPQMALRLHLGRLIREEARRESMPAAGPLSTC